jgi:hypothetical protein
LSLKPGRELSRDGNPSTETPPSSVLDSLLSRQPLVFSFLAACLVLAITNLFFTPAFMTNDDHFKIMAAKGVGTHLKPSEFIGYSSVILGFILKALYTALPKIPWYDLFVMGSIFTGIWAMFYAVLLGTLGRFRFLMLFFSTLVVNIFFLYTPQFTFASLLLAQGGVLLLAALWLNEPKDYFLLRMAWAGTLLFASSITRFSAFGLLSLCALPLVIFLVWKQPLTPLRKTLLGFASACLLLAAGGYVFDRHYTAQKPGWKEFNAFDAQRVDLQDYRKPNYNNETKPVFDSVGWSENDLDLFYYWYYPDPNVYSTEKLAKLNRAFSKFQPERERDPLFEMPSVMMTLLFFGMLVFLLPKNARTVIASAALVTLLVFLYFYFFMRVPKRVFLPVFSFLLCETVFFVVPNWKAYFQKPDFLPWLGKLEAYFFAVFLLGAGLFVKTQVDFKQFWHENSRKLYSSLEMFHPQDDQLYVVWGACFPFECLRVFDNFEFARNFHMIVLAVGQRSPDTAAMMEHFKVRDLARDLVDNPKFFLICRPYEEGLYKTLVKERYGMEVEFETTFKSALDPFFVVNRIHLAKKQGTTVKKN